MKLMVMIANRYKRNSREGRVCSADYTKINETSPRLVCQSDLAKRNGNIVCRAEPIKRHETKLVC